MGWDYGGSNMRGVRRRGYGRGLELHRRDLRWKTAPIVAAIGLALGAGTLAGAAGAAGPHGPGSMTAGPAVVAGSKHNALHFDYTAPTTNAVTGQVQLVVPTGWTTPQKRNPAKKGAVSISASTCTHATLGQITGTGPWTVAVAVTCPASTGFTLAYGGVTAPTTASAVGFPAAHVIHAGSTPLTTQPSITVQAGPADHLGVSTAVGTIDPSPPSGAATTADFSGPYPSSATFFATSVDQYDNPIGDVTASSTFSGANCTGNTCGGVAPGNYVVTATDGSLQGSAPLTAASEDVLSMSCRGQNYDVNVNIEDGCEVLTTNTATTQAAAPTIATLSCNDASTFAANTDLPSDGRVHTNPAVSGFDTASGSAPFWSAISATGGFCTDDYSVKLVVTNSTQPTCYRLTVVTNTSTQFQNADATGTVTLTKGAGAYTDPSTVYVEVSKTCTSAVKEDASVAVSGHL